jgi:arsenate reductase
MTVTIWHNPRCSKSRQTLGLLEERGIAPNIVTYLETPPSVEELVKVLDLLGRTPRELMRKGEAEYKEQGLDNVDLTDAQLVEAMVATPKLIERPVVLANGKAAVGRPPESVLNIL